jgi:hypothetical protein
MRFSERMGIIKPKDVIERNDISKELRNSLWTILIELIIDNENYQSKFGIKYSELENYFRQIWIGYFKLPIDELPWRYGNLEKYNAVDFLKKWFFSSEWYLILDFVELSSTYHPEFTTICNKLFQNEMSAYRFVNGLIVEIVSEEEIKEIENAISKSDRYQSVKDHLTSSLLLLSNKNSPDYRNSIKESISAVEALVKIITNSPNNTLGEALKVIESKHQIPKSLKSAFNSLYGFTSSSGGIRHSFLENDIEISIEEARFMLIACSAFINYLINKL